MTSPLLLCGGVPSAKTSQLLDTTPRFSGCGSDSPLTTDYLLFLSLHPLTTKISEKAFPMAEHITRDSERGSSIGEKEQLGADILIESVGYVSPSQDRGGSSVLARAQRLVAKLGVEQRGIERVLPDERTDTGMSKIGTLWLSANMTVSTFAIGALAQPVFDLGFVDTALTIVFVNILGILPVCFFSTFGPRLGLRQMVLSRYFFGYYGVKLSKLPA